MTLQTVTIPQQAGPAEPPPAAAPPAAKAPALIGKDRPLTAEEREFRLSLVGLFLFLQALIVPLLLISHYAWS